MSEVRFESRDDVAPLAATERARAATIVDDLALGLLAPHKPAVARRLYQLLRPDHFLRTVPVEDPRWAEEFRAAFTGHVDSGLVCPDGRVVDTFALALNTAILVGNDTVRLLAWLHAECEAHGYVEPARAGWAADVVADGLASGLLRGGVGWDGVVRLLRGAREPVVLSVAGHGGFAGDAGDAERPPWQAVRRTPAEDGRTAAGWSRAVDRLRADPSVVPLDPDTVRRPYGHGLTVLDLIAPDSAERLAASAPASPGR